MILQVSLPWVLICLNRDQLRLVLEGFRRANGKWATDRYVLYTSSVLVRDELMVALLHAGFSAYFICHYKKGTIRGYKRLKESRDSKTYSVQQYQQMTAAEKEDFRPIHATADAWSVNYADATSPAGKTSCWPTLHSSSGVRPSKGYVGRVWCVTVPHGLVVAQRAVVGKDGFVTQASRPVICGNCRPVMNARANQLAGKGVESVENYRNCKVFFMNIENIHAMRSSYQRLIKACQQDAHGAEFATAVAGSQWLAHIGMVLKATYQMVLAIDRDKQSVVSHCSDGWDRTSQLVSLTELCLDPYYRTLEGSAAT